MTNDSVNSILLTCLTVTVIAFTSPTRLLIRTDWPFERSGEYARPLPAKLSTQMFPFRFRGSFRLLIESSSRRESCIVIRLGCAAVQVKGLPALVLSALGLFGGPRTCRNAADRVSRYPRPSHRSQTATIDSRLVNAVIIAPPAETRFPWVYFREKCQDNGQGGLVSRGDREQGYIRTQRCMCRRGMRRIIFQGIIFPRGSISAWVPAAFPQRESAQHRFELQTFIFLELLPRKAHLKA